MVSPLFGKLSLSAIPYDNPIIMGAFAFMVLAVLALVVLVSALHRWKWLWTEWLTSVDHKKIGIMYIAVAVVMGARGFADAVLMRSQQALAFGPGQGYLPPEHFDQIFSGHGVIMILFLAMPLLIGLINIVVPPQIGARDVAFPFLNSVSLWLFVVGVVLANVSLGIGEFAKTGWNAYPPLSELAYSPGVGVDYYIWSIQISGLGTLLTGVNFITTILKMRAPGMKLMDMPIFTWMALCTMILVIGAFPILTVALALLTLDRYLGFHFFTTTLGGNPMLWVNLFWAWGHPEVYIIILPAFGIHAEVAATFSGKRMFGYTSVVLAGIAIMVLSYLVWLHHFFTMGSGADVNFAYGLSTMLIAIPTGVKIYNWVFTIFRGKLRLTTPILWTIGFVVTFTFGGMSGVMLGLPVADFVLHNSEFLIAHFHNVIVGGTIFAAIGGITYWFPKAYGFKLDDRLGKVAGGIFLAAFYVTFVPLYILGFMGMTRRLNYTTNPAWRPWLYIAAFGVVLFAIAFALLVLQLILGFIKRKENLDLTGDPWDGRTLEWSIPSPPPAYNFARIPTVTGREAFWAMKHPEAGAASTPTDGGHRPPSEPYQDIVVPRNTPAGILIGAFALAFGFAMVWYIWWLAIVGFLGMVVTVIIRNSSNNIHTVIPAAEVERIERSLGTARPAPVGSR